MTKRSPFRYFKTSPEIICLAVMMYVGFPLSLRNVEDLLHERGIDISHESVRFWWNRFGSMFAAEIRRNRVQKMRAYSNWQWHLDEVFVKINGVTRYPWRAVDHEGEVLESYVTKRRDRKAALKFTRKSSKRYGSPEVIVTDKLRSYGAAIKVIGYAKTQETCRWLSACRAAASPLRGTGAEDGPIRLRRCGRSVSEPQAGRGRFLSLRHFWSDNDNYRLQYDKTIFRTDLYFGYLLPIRSLINGHIEF